MSSTPSKTSRKNTKTEVSSKGAHDSAVISHETAGTGSPGTASTVTGGTTPCPATPPIPRPARHKVHASGLANEFPSTTNGFYTEGEVYTNTEPGSTDSSGAPERPSAGGTQSVGSAGKFVGQPGGMHFVSGWTRDGWRGWTRGCATGDCGGRPRASRASRFMGDDRRVMSAFRRHLGLCVLPTLPLM
ncbi:hypothetical protein B0H13DRAFT_1888299 [Mycena leptocephala]|nr:hypothetical protein B0H13DRAFT_1888299 [Mycena leptocephala]